MMGPRAWRQARRQRRLLAEAIDRTFYVAQLAEPPGDDFDPVEHYLTEGWKAGFEPAPWFDSEHYARAYPDAAAGELPPFLHYLTYGKAENRAVEATPAGYEDVRPWFDAAYYRARNPDLAGIDDAALFDHFAFTGWREGRDPNSWFSLAAWREANPDAPDDINPLALYMREAVRFGRPLAAGEPVWRRPSWNARRRRAADSGMIDEDFYLDAYPEVAAAGLSALDHYLVAGAVELRNPSPRFDTGWWAAHHGVAPRQALFDFMDRRDFLHLPPASGDGRPPMSATFDPAVEPAPARSAVHLHLRRIEWAETLISALAGWPPEMTIWASVGSQADAAWLRRRIAVLRPQASVDVRFDPTLGASLLPLAFADRAGEVDAILCAHSEAPLTAGGADDRRQRRLVERLFGSPSAAGQAAAWFVKWPDLGWLYPATDFIPPAAATGDDWIDPAGWLNPRALQSLAKEAAPPGGVFDDELSPAAQEVRLVEALAMRLEAAAWRAAPFTWTARRPVEMAPRRSVGSRLNAPSQRWPRENPAVAVHGPKPLAPRSQVFDPRRLDIAWIMPDLLLGSGGHMTILRLVEQLARFGHRQTIWIQNPRGPDPQVVKHRMQRWFRPIPDDVAVVGLPDDVRAISADAVIATEAWTAFPAANVTNAKARFYLIQDYEPLFHAAGEAAMLAEQTYGLGLDALAAGDWLLEKAESHGMWARKWDLAVDHSAYFPPPRKRPTAPATPRIAVYARRSTPRRAVGLAFAALTELAKRGVAFEAVLFGEAEPPTNLAFPHIHAGIVDAQGLGDLYRAADIGLVFSATNYSLVPLEMMACDLPVVELDGESTRAVFKGGEALLAAPHPMAVADALQGLLADAAARKAQAARGKAFVKALSWEASARSVEAAIVERLGETGARAIDPQAVCAPAVGKVRRVSVVIPTYNGGRLFDRVLAAAASQDCGFEYDVLVIDSGSTDRTAEVASKVGGRVWLHTIDKSQFQHGRTRNLGVELTDGDIVAFLTQDALPGDRQWLSRLVEGFDVSSRTALVYGRHRAYPAHGLFAARDLDDLFDRLHQLGPLFSGRLGLPSFIHPGSEEWRRLMGFYSDNNSALLRAAWRQLPYPEVDWGEDQVLGWEMVRQGFDKVYADEAVVFHSHQRKAGDQLQTAIEEGQLFKAQFGIDLVKEAEAPGLVEAMAAADTAWAAAHDLTPGALAMRLESQRLAVEGRLRGAARAAWE